MTWPVLPMELLRRSEAEQDSEPVCLLPMEFVLADTWEQFRLLHELGLPLQLEHTARYPVYKILSNPLIVSREHNCLAQICAQARHPEDSIQLDVAAVSPSCRPELSSTLLRKVWIQSCDPYPINLTLKTLQQMLNVELPMDRDCFNLVVRKIMFDNIETVKKRRGLISKHYLDMRFWMITDFGRHPDYRKKLDVEQLAHSVGSWPGIKYSVSTCRWIHLPIQSGPDFILIILDKDTRTVYILDPTPIDPTYQRNPIAKYVKRILWIAEQLPKAMSKTCPGSTWNENIFLWQQKIVPDISGHKRELSGYLVTFLMSTWEDENVHLPFSKDGYELRKQIVGQLLTFKENKFEDNMPTGVMDFIRCIRKYKQI